MPFIKVDGKLYDYAEYEDIIKPLKKEQIKRSDLCVVCGKKATCFIYKDEECISYCIEHYKHV